MQASCATLPCCLLSSSLRASQVVRVLGRGKLLQHHNIWKGTEDRGSHCLLQVECARRPRFGSTLSLGGLGSIAEVLGCCFHDLNHNGQLGVEGHRLRICENFYFQESPVGSQDGCRKGTGNMSRWRGAASIHRVEPPRPAPGGKWWRCQGPVYRADHLLGRALQTKVATARSWVCFKVSDLAYTISMVTSVCTKAGLWFHPM